MRGKANLGTPGNICHRGCSGRAMKKSEWEACVSDCLENARRAYPSLNIYRAPAAAAARAAGRTRRRRRGRARPRTHRRRRPRTHRRRRKGGTCTRRR